MRGRVTVTSLFVITIPCANTTMFLMEKYTHTVTVVCTQLKLSQEDVRFVYRLFWDWVTFYGVSALYGQIWYNMQGQLTQCIIGY